MPNELNEQVEEALAELGEELETGEPESGEEPAPTDEPAPGEEGASDKPSEQAEADPDDEIIAALEKLPPAMRDAALKALDEDEPEAKAEAEPKVDDILPPEIGLDESRFDNLEFVRYQHTHSRNFQQAINETRVNADAYNSANAKLENLIKIQHEKAEAGEDISHLTDAIELAREAAQDRYEKYSAAKLAAEQQQSTLKMLEYVDQLSDASPDIKANKAKIAQAFHSDPRIMQLPIKNQISHLIHIGAIKTKKQETAKPTKDRISMLKSKLAVRAGGGKGGVTAGKPAAGVGKATPSGSPSKPGGSAKYVSVATGRPMPPLSPKDAEYLLQTGKIKRG